MRRIAGALKLILFLAAVGSTAMTATARGEPKKDDPPKREDASKPREARSVSAPDAQQYCANIAAVAGAARSARQERQLLEIEQQIGRRLTELETKRVELQELLDRHEALLKKADEGLVAIYSRMRPDSAAAQLANMEEDMAAALLMRLQAKQSSAILNEMEAGRAVVLTKKMGGASAMAARAGKKP